MASGVEALIQTLSSDLRPVRRLWPPAVRAGLWLSAVLAAGLVMGTFADVPAMRARLSALPDLRLATLGAVLTAIAAGFAAFQASVPGRSGAWMLLPLPGVVLWSTASGMGCLRHWAMPGLHPTGMHEAAECLTFIVLVSVPASVLLLLMLRRAAPVQLGRMASMGGLAAAAAAASLLTLFHPHDASVIDVVSHATAVALVVLANRAWSGRLLAPATSP